MPGRASGGSRSNQTASRFDADVDDRSRDRRQEMDGSRFDDLVRNLLTGTSRRTMLSILTGSLAAVAFGRRAEAKQTCGGFPCSHACCKGT
jgi:hypothetical protein